MEVCSEHCAFISNGTVSMASKANRTQILCFGQNVTAPKDQLQEADMPYKILVAVLASLLALIILVGNGLIIVSVMMVKKLRQPANYLIVSLALSDFLVALVVLPLTIVYDILGEWVFGSTICNIHVSFDVICCTTSIMNLCMISIDRYFMITKPMTYPKRRTGKLMALMITTAWIISCLIILPALFGFTENVTDDPNWIPLGSNSTLLRNVSALAETDALLGQTDSEQSTSYWQKCSNHDDVLEFTKVIEREHNLSKIHLATNSNHKLNFQLQVSNDLTNIVEKFDFDSLSSTQIIPAVSTRYIRFLYLGTLLLFQQPHNIPVVRCDLLRILLNATAGLFNESSFLSFDVYGEIIHGKTCLISQEVWFTIYSTVGAFYLPLCVMLCMYWKIYVEASKFKARHRPRSKSFCDESSSITNLNAIKDERSAVPYNTDDNRPSNRTDGSRCFFQLSRDSTGEDLAGTTRTREIDSENSESGKEVFESDALEPKYKHDYSQGNGELDQGQTLLQQHSGSEWSFKFHNNNTNGNRFSKRYEENGKTPFHRQYSLLSNTMLCLENGGSNTTTTTSINKQTPFHFNGLMAEYIQQNNGPDDPCNQAISQATELDRLHKPANASNLVISRADFQSNFQTLRANPIFNSRRKTRTGADIFTPLRRRVSASFSRDRLRNAKAIRTLGIIVFVFTFCWLPFFIVTIIRPFVCEYPESQDCFPLWLVRLVLWLGYLNSALNPIIYVGFSPDLRETFRFLICCKCNNVDRRLAQIELRHAIEKEKRDAEQISKNLNESVF